MLTFLPAPESILTDWFSIGPVQSLPHWARGQPPVAFTFVAALLALALHPENQDIMKWLHWTIRAAPGVWGIHIHLFFVEGS
jgi:hypothetical protein